MHLSDDEARLVHGFRCLSSIERSDTLQNIARILDGRYSEGRAIYDYAPDAEGLEPEAADRRFEVNAVIYVLASGIDATGDSWDTITGISEWDESEVIPSFVKGATEAADRQGSFFNYGKEFARAYVKAWRWELTWDWVYKAKQAGVYLEPPAQKQSE